MNKNINVALNDGESIEAAILNARSELTAKLIKYGKKQKLSDYAISKMCGFPQPQLGRIKSGEVSFNVHTLMRMAYGLKLMFVFDGTGKKLTVELLDSSYRIIKK